MERTQRTVKTVGMGTTAGLDRRRGRRGLPGGGPAGAARRWAGALAAGVVLTALVGAFGAGAAGAAGVATGSAAGSAAASSAPSVAPSVAAAAPSGSIVYIKGPDVWLSDPSATTRVQVTRDGGSATTDGSGGIGYIAPSESDGGTIVAVRNQRVPNPGYDQGWIWVLDRNGGFVRKFSPPQFSIAGSVGCPVPVSTVPRGILDAAVSPDGTRVAYLAMAYFQSPTCVVSDAYETFVANIDGTGARMITRAADGSGAQLELGQWDGSSRLLLDSSAFGSTALYSVTMPSSTAQTWSEAPDFFDGAYIQPNLRLGKLATHGYSAISSGQVLRLWSSTGVTSPPTIKCEYFAVAGGANSFVVRPSWAPDASALAWQESDGVVDQPDEGIYTMPVGDISGSSCPAPTSKRLLIAGGMHPSWSAAAMPGSTTPALSVGDVRVTEGNTGTKSATFTLSRAGSTAGTSSVTVATSNGTAVAGSDYTALAPTTVTFAAGETTKTVTVAVIGDTVDEPNETFSLLLSSPVGATVADGTGVATIVDDDGPTPTYVRVNDVRVAEGNTGSKPVTFTISRSGVTTGASSVRVATSNGTAVAGSDYTALASTTVSFAAGETTKTVAVAVTGDTVDEPNETFSLRLSSPVGATVADDTGVATIVDDDAPTYVRVNDVSLAEGSSGTRPATFTISRSGVTTGASSVRVATANGTAVAGSDYTALASTTVSFAAGETTKTVAVAVIGDTVDEPNETFSLRLSSPVGATVADATGVATIVDDDGPITPGPTTFLSVSDVTLREGSTGSSTATFTVTRSGATSGASSVRVATANGTAVAGSDYTALAPTTVSFAAGETVKTVAVAVTGDTVFEPDETFSLRLSSPVGATVADDTGVATIVDDDPAVYLSVSDVSVTEGNAGSSTATLTITRTGATGVPVSLRWNTANGTAVAGSDYTAAASTAIAFAAGQTTATVTVTVLGDTTVEPDERFFVKLTSLIGATASDDTGTVTVVNDD